MTNLERIENAMRSYKGRMKRLENDPNVDLQAYCDRCSSLEHEFFETVERILEKDENGGKDQKMSSVDIARAFNLIDKKG